MESDIESTEVIAVLECPICQTFHADKHIESSKSERNRKIIELRQKGWSFGQISVKVGNITRQRCEQIYKDWSNKIPISN